MATINDVVLIYMENKPLTFARIEDIEPDHKRDWYHVKFLFLQLPIRTGIWILKDIYINGEEFTMGGKKMEIKLVEKSSEILKEKKKKPVASEKKTKIISMDELRKKNNENKPETA